MSLRVKSLLVAAATLATLLMVFLVLMSFIIAEIYTRLEQQDTVEHVARAVNALTNELETLNCDQRPANRLDFPCCKGYD